MKGIIYTRVSSGEQVEGTSLEFQEEVCKKYCQEKGIEVVSVFREEGESAKDLSLNNRKVFLDALEYCRKNKGNVEAFIVLRLNRFARNTEDHFAVRKILIDYGTTLHSVTEPIDSSPTGKFFETIIAGASEYENAIRKRQCTDGMMTQINRGIYPWKAPTGYRCLHSKKHGEKKTRPDPPDEQSFPIIQKALKEFSKGIYSQKELTGKLDEWGLARIRGKETSMQFVDKMLSKHLKFYTGIIVNPWTQEERRGLHKPMISEEEMGKITYFKSGGKLKLKRHRFNPDFALRRTILCGECGHTLTGSYSRGNGGKYANYHCYNKECSMYGKSLPKKDIEADFIKHLRTITPKNEFLELFKETALDFWQEKGQAYQTETARIQKAINLLEKKRKRLYEMREDGSYTKEEFFTRKAEVDNEIVAEQISLNESKIDQLDIEGALNYAMHFIDDLGRQWFDMPDKIKPRFQKLVFPEGVSYKKNVGFGTARLGLVYSINATFDGKKSSLVARRGIEPLLPG